MPAVSTSSLKPGEITARDAESVGDIGFVSGNGISVFWKFNRAQDRISLFAESEELAAIPFRQVFNERFLKKLDAGDVLVPEKVRQIALPFQSQKALRIGEMVPFVSENGNFAFASKIFGYDFSFEYDMDTGKWRDMEAGEFLAEPEPGEVSETLWLLHVLKKRGALDELSPENYPVFFEMTPVSRHERLTVKDAMKILRAREKILREAVMKEFGNDVRNFKKWIDVVDRTGKVSPTEIDEVKRAFSNIDKAGAAPDGARILIFDGEMPTTTDILLLLSQQCNYRESPNVCIEDDAYFYAWREGDFRHGTLVDKQTLSVRSWNFTAGKSSLSW